MSCQRVLINQAIPGTAVGAEGGAGFFNGKIDPGMRIPNLLLVRGARQGQVSAADFVFFFRVGAFQAGIGGIGGMCHNAISLLSSIKMGAMDYPRILRHRPKQCQ